MKLNKYNRMARIYPAIISIIPVMILINSLLSDLNDPFLNDIIAKIISQLGLGVILLYLVSQLNRFISKEFFEKKYFQSELSFPTTNLLLLNDNGLSADYKNKIRLKVQKDFDIELPNIELELENNYLARKRIAETVGLVRVKLKNNSLLLQHNIEYGFVRNLIAGSLLGSLCSVLLSFYFLTIHKNSSLFFLSICLFIFYLAILFLRRYLITKFGYLYAKRLYQEYLGE